MISEFRTAGEFQNVIQSGEYSGLDVSGMTTEGCKGEEDTAKGRIKGKERKHDRCIIYAREMPGNTGRGKRGGARAHWS